MHPHPLRRLLSSRCQTPFCQAERLPREAASPPPPSARRRRHDGGRASEGGTSERASERHHFSKAAPLPKCLRCGGKRRRWAGEPRLETTAENDKKSLRQRNENKRPPTTCCTSARQPRREQMHLDKYLSAEAETFFFFFPFR